MNAYATACDDYRKYMLAKKNLKISQDNFNEASRAVNSGNISEESNLRRFKIEIDEYTQKMENLKGKINANLATGQFEWIPGDPEMDDLVPGDVLLTEGVHTEMYIGDGQNVRALSNYDGYDGDSSGDEICVCPNSDWTAPWQGVLRYKGN